MPVEVHIKVGLCKTQFLKLPGYWFTTTIKNRPRSKVYSTWEIRLTETSINVDWDNQKQPMTENNKC